MKAADERLGLSEALAAGLRDRRAPAAAYVLMQELRIKAACTSLAHAQVSTLRERLLKLAVWVERSTRRYVLHLPDSAPWRWEWSRIARQLGAVPI